MVVIKKNRYKNKKAKKMRKGNQHNLKYFYLLELRFYQQ